jgi:hypothetical protein
MKKEDQDTRGRSVMKTKGREELGQEEQRTRRPEYHRTSLKGHEDRRTRRPEDELTNTRGTKNTGKPERTWTRVLKTRDQRTGKKKNRGHEYQKIK